MKLMTRGRFACAVLSWIAALALQTIAPVALAQSQPIANAGPDLEIADTDGQPGEVVTLDGSQSYDPDGEVLVLHRWDLRPPESPAQVLGNTEILQVRLPDGVHTISLAVADVESRISFDTVFVTVGAPMTPPVANAGGDRTINDTDGAAGETVTLDGSASMDPDGTIASYEWYRWVGHLRESLGSGRTIQPRLADGVHSIQLVVTDNSGNTAADGVLVTVNAYAVSNPPTANAGADRTVDDTDNIDGESVLLDGRASTDPDNDIVSYQWYGFNGESNQELGSGATLQTRLFDGANIIELVVRDSAGNTDSTSVTITVNEPTPAELNADAGPDRTIDDTDNAPGENVLLDGRASTDPSGTASYTWFRLDNDSRVELGSGVTLQTRLPDGENVIELSVSDDSGEVSTYATSWDTVVITVRAPAPNGQPTANAGLDRTVADTDRAAGENVVLDGSASSAPNGTIVNYTWTRLNGESSEELGSGSSPTLQVRLPDGEHLIQLVVTDSSENSASDTVVITVNAPASIPTANAGADRTIADTDTQDGEDVVLDASNSVDPDGTIVDYAWSRVDGESTEALGNGVTLQTRLADGEHVIQLVVTDDQGNTASDTVIITVNQVVVTSLENLPGLTPNQQRVGQALDRICAQLRSQAGGEGPQLSADQQDLLNRCNGLQMNNTTANQVDALDELVADDFALARTQTLLFANTQYAGVMDRLMALRGGAKGLSLAGLNIIVDGQQVPLAQLQEMAKGLLGGGASADEPGGLLEDKWGLWARGNYSIGEKDRTTRSPGFDADQWAMVGGVDYRFNDRIVGGVSLAYGQSSIDIDDGQGGLETDTWAASLYGSSYVGKKYYVDAIINVANADYGADRNIAYVDGNGLVDTDARGETSGMTYSAGISGGRDFLYGGFTISPTVGLFYIDATIDSFTEQGAAGLNLIYDEQSFQSFTGNFGFRVTYAWNVSWGVLLPHARVDYVREFKNDVDVFGVRFAADPNAASAPPILVATDNPDESYFRLATGVSAQFVHGISGYVEYQRLESFEFIDFQDVSLGLRFQKSF